MIWIFDPLKNLCLFLETFKSSEDNVSCFSVKRFFNPSHLRRLKIFGFFGSTEAARLLRRTKIQRNVVLVTKGWKPIIWTRPISYVIMIKYVQLGKAYLNRFLNWCSFLCPLWTQALIMHILYPKEKGILSHQFFRWIWLLKIGVWPPRTLYTSTIVPRGIKSVL